MAGSELLDSNNRNLRRAELLMLQSKLSLHTHVTDGFISFDTAYLPYLSLVICSNMRRHVASLSTSAVVKQTLQVVSREDACCFRHFEFSQRVHLKPTRDLHVGCTGPKQRLFCTCLALLGTGKHQGCSYRCHAEQINVCKVGAVDIRSLGVVTGRAHSLMRLLDILLTSGLDSLLSLYGAISCKFTRSLASSAHDPCFEEPS